MRSEAPQRGVILAAQIAGFAAIIVAVAETLRWVIGFAMTQANVELVGPDTFRWASASCWIVELAGTALAAAGLVVGFRRGGLRWCRGAVLTAGALVFLWAWYFFSRNVDVWGWSRLSVDDPEFQRLGALAGWTEVIGAGIAAVLLLWGGIRLLRSVSARSRGRARPA